MPRRGGRPKPATRLFSVNGFSRRVEQSDCLGAATDLSRSATARRNIGLGMTITMQWRRFFCVAAVIAAFVSIEPAFAAPEATESTDQAGPTNGAFGIPLVEHRLDVEMTVRNWVLCASKLTAEKLALAREDGPETAAEVFADLEAARSCGRLAEMQVILQERIFESHSPAIDQMTVYGALINISGAWASGFVVSGAMAEQ